MTPINTHTVSATVKPASKTLPYKGLKTTTFVRAGSGLGLDTQRYMLASLDIPVILDVGEDGIKAAPKT
ncbi:MAG: hypothetical protein DRR19_11290 [Candidatus Parabeggiatoa sp. nov. 1]|nr:MAG: hypothetical protein DRR19_11290 [Gammaproteobacteria bacterium]